MRRVQNRTATELYETLENLTNVRHNFLNAFEKLKHEENIFVTDGNRPLELISDDIWKCVDGMLKG